MTTHEWDARGGNIIKSKSEISPINESLPGTV